MTINKILNCTIVGGGSSAWLTAAHLLADSNLNLTIIDKELSTPIGVGEATILNFDTFMNNCGFNIDEWFNEIDASIKCAIYFPDWIYEGNQIWHPFESSNHQSIDIRSVWSLNQNYSIRDYGSKQNFNSVIKENKIDAINFGPFNKTSLKLGGNKFSDELHLMAEKLEVKKFFCEFNVVDNFWTARVTSHIPISEVPSHIKKEKIIKPIKLINEAMILNGVKNPRVAVQALNPHAEFGTEEKDEIIPAIELAKSLGINADGPLPCDTSFITAFKKIEKIVNGY